MMFQKERAEIRILSNWADAQRLDYVRDLLRQAESEIKLHEEHRARVFTTDCGGRMSLQDSRLELT